MNRFEIYPYLSDLSIYAKYLTLSLILVAISLIGDQLLQIKRSLVNDYLIAICDNLIHAFIANISWILIIVSLGAPILESTVLLQSLISAIIASVIDLDHVIAAHSFDLKIISELQNRPFLHNSSLTLLISITIIIIGLLSHNWTCHTFGWIFLTASFTHHLRDALRHGFWFSPFHTLPVPFWVYVLILISYPLLCSWIMDIMAQKFFKTFQTNQSIKYISLKTEEV